MRLTSTLKRLSLLPALLFCLLLTGCGWSEGTDLAELSVAEFHENYNRGAYRVIYANATPEFQNFVTEDSFTHLLEKLNNRLGQHISSSLTNWSANTSISEGTIITLLYTATYENDDQAKVSFTYKIKDAIAKLHNFNVSSKAMNKAVQNNDI